MFGILTKLDESTPIDTHPPTPSNGHSPAREPGVRLRLLDAAMQLLAVEGIHALTQTRVAAWAGLRQSHLTYYFPTRSDLLKGIVEHVVDEGPGMVRGDASALQPTLGSMRTYIADRVADGRLGRVMLALATASDEDPSLKHWMVEFDRRCRDMFGEVLASLGYRVKPQELLLFHATTIGISVMHASEGTADTSAETRKLTAVAFDRLIAGARRA